MTSNSPKTNMCAWIKVRKKKGRKKCLKKNRLWCFNVIHLRQWQEITPHGARTQTHTCRSTHTHIWLWGVWNQISPNLYSGVTEVKMQTQMITARAHTLAHITCMHAYTDANTCIWHTHTCRCTHRGVTLVDLSVEVCSTVAAFLIS